MRAWIAAVLSVVFALPAVAEDRGAKTIAVFQGWMEAKGVETGQIAVAHRGRIMASEGIGRAGPIDLASLSKAITASCTAALVKEGTLSWDAPIRTHLPDLSGPLGSATLAELVTHSAGLRGDSTQGPMADWRGSGALVYDKVVSEISGNPLRSQRYRYSNDNYAVIAAVISAATGAAYDAVCADAVLRGLKSAAPSPLFGRYAAWGGWRITPEDYLKFLWRIYGGQDPRAAPKTEIEPGVYYGLGLVWRDFQDGANQWHFGALCFEDGPNFFTFAVVFANGWSVVTYADGCPQSDWFLSLDQAIVDGIFR